MTLAQMAGKDSLRVHCLFDPAEANAHEADYGLSVSDVVKTTAPVELIYFQGPHYGDRYGIAHAAFGTLEAQNLKILAAGCTGASIYIIVPEKSAQTAVRCLSEAFEIPETTT